MYDSSEDTEGSAHVSSGEASDWLVRSALPRFLSLAGLWDAAAYFRALPSFDGQTSSGRLRGWQGAGSRLKAAEERLDGMRGRLTEMQPFCHWTDSSPWERELAPVRSLAYKSMLPSRVGWAANRVVLQCDQLVQQMMPLVLEEDQRVVADAWTEVGCELANRVRRRSMGLPTIPMVLQIDLNSSMEAIDGRHTVDFWTAHLSRSEDGNHPLSRPLSGARTGQ